MFKGFLFLGIPLPSLVEMSEVEEGPGDGGKVPDEATVEIDEAYESLHVSLVLWDGPIVDSSNLNRVYLDLVLRDDQSKVLNPFPMELTLLWAEEQLVFHQYFQDPPDRLFMFLLHPCKDQNVVQVHYHNPFSYEGPEDVIHHSLEGSEAVGHSEEHHKGFKEATIGAEGCLPFVFGLDTYVIETPSDIKLCEVLGSAELGDEFGDEGEGVPVLDGYGVQYAIVLDQPEQTILLFNEEHRGGDGGLGGSDSSSM